MLSSENTSDDLNLVEVEQNLPTLEIPRKLTFRKICKIKVPNGDIYINWDLPKLLATVEPEIIEEIKANWQERDHLDLERGWKHELAVIDFNKQRLRNVLKWHLRGMPVYLAVRKVRSHAFQYLSKGMRIIDDRRSNQIVQGFKIGYKVMISDQNYTVESMIGWRGIIVKLTQNHCLVKFFLDPQDDNGRDKIRHMKYDSLSIVSPEAPQLKLKKSSESISESAETNKSNSPGKPNQSKSLVPPAPPKLKLKKSSESISESAEANTSNSLDRSQKSIVKIEQNQKIPTPASVKEEVKLKHDLTQLISKVKFLKINTLPESRDKLSIQAENKSSYTATELAEKLNVSKAKIYTMRNKGELESLGYRVESNVRFLSFVAINNSD